MTVKCSKSMQILRLSVIKAIVTKDYYVLLTINSCDISRRRVGYPEAWISARGAHRKRKTAGLSPRRSPFAWSRRSAEQAQHAVGGLRGERQRSGRQLLAGLQRQKVGAFLVGIREHQVVRADLQRVDRRLGEVLTGLHDRQARAEVRRLRTQRI